MMCFPLEFIIPGDFGASNCEISSSTSGWPPRFQGTGQFFLKRNDLDLGFASPKSGSRKYVPISNWDEVFPVLTG